MYVVCVELPKRVLNSHGAPKTAEDLRLRRLLRIQQWPGRRFGSRVSLGGLLKYNTPKQLTIVGNEGCPRPSWGRVIWGGLEFGGIPKAGLSGSQFKACHESASAFSNIPLRGKSSTLHYVFW